MSSVMPSPSETRDLRLYLEDMLVFAERALAYAGALAQADWMADRMRYVATPGPSCRGGR